MKDINSLDRELESVKRASYNNNFVPHNDLERELNSIKRTIDELKRKLQ